MFKFEQLEVELHKQLSLYEMCIRDSMREIPMVMVLISRFSSCIMVMVSMISLIFSIDFLP